MTDERTAGQLARLRSALSSERDEERSRFALAAAELSLEERQGRGWALVQLVARDAQGGVGGRRVITFEREKGELGPTRLGPGSPVRASRRREAEGEPPQGVVVRTTRRQIAVAFDAESPDWLDEGHLNLELLADETTYQRLTSALSRLEAAQGRHLALRRVLFEGVPPAWDADRAPADADIDPTFNPDQRAAVALALSARDLALVHGPPGTGKTTVLVEVARLAVGRGEKVLAAAASNAAVDLLAGRIADRGVRVVRLGHPARVDPSIGDLTLESQVEAHERYQVGRELVRRAMELLAVARKQAARGRSADRFAQARAARSEAHALFKEAREHERLAERDVLDRAQVIASTATGLDSRRLGSTRFQLALVDESSQASEPVALMPFEWADRVVLAGDPHQLPPTVLSRKALQLGLGVSLFERLVAEHGGGIVRMLTLQHRMHSDIASFPSKHFYEGKLVPHPQVAHHLLSQLAGVTPSAGGDRPLVFVDTAGTGHQEELAREGGSRSNPGEAQLLARELDLLLRSGLNPEQVAVITPYEAQVQLLRELLPHEGLEIDTVDSFQGREKEAVLVSLVRSNPDGELGFLEDVRRMNVAITRARRRLWVIGDSATVASNGFYADFIDHVGRLGGHLSAWELDPSQG